MDETRRVCRSLLDRRRNRVVRMSAASLVGPHKVDSLDCGDIGALSPSTLSTGVKVCGLLSGELPDCAI